MRCQNAIKKIQEAKYGVIYYCNHELYNECTLFKIGNKGLAVIQQRFDAISKSSRWTSIDTELIDVIYSNKYFENYFNTYADKINNGLYPTVSLRQIMWALRMHPLKREKWETYFDRKPL